MRFVPEVKTVAEAEEEAGTIGLALAFVYGTGLATNNLFLANYGLSDFSLLKPKAIFTGAVVLGSMVVICAGPMHFVSRYLDSRDPAWPQEYGSQTKPLAILLKLILPFAAVMALFLAVAFAPGSVTGQPSERSDHWLLFTVFKAFLFFVSACTAAVCFIQALIAFRHLKSSGNFQGLASRLARTSLFFTGSLVSLAIYISLFVGNFYTALPGSVGGPGLEPVQFEVTQSDTEEWKQLGLQFEDNSRITQPVRVLLETEDTAVILFSQPNFGDFLPTVLRIDRKMLEHSIILRKK